jgi:hypothetical protein
MADIFSADIEEKLEIKDNMTQKEIDRILALKAQRESEKELIDDLMSTSKPKHMMVDIKGKNKKFKK